MYKKKRSRMSKANASDAKTDRTANDRKPQARGRNDANWYTKDSELAKDAGSFAFTWPTGSIVPRGEAYADLKLPGVMALVYYPTFGVSSDPSSAINVAARNIYSFVRHANSGHTNYDAPDLMMYLMMMDQAYSFYAHLVRIYGIACTYAQRNRNIPEGLFKAAKVDYVDITRHLADLKFYIDTVAVKLGSFCVPSTLGIYQRHMWMNSNIYADSPSIKSQFYMFVPAVYGTYIEEDGAGYIKANFYKSGSHPADYTFSELTTIMDSIINSIVLSEDMNIMSGDILKAYGEEGLFKIARPTIDYELIPIYSQEVLGQIKNTTVYNGNVAYSIPSGLTYPAILYQNPTTGELLQAMKLNTFYKCPVTLKKVMTAFNENPNEDEVLVNSRLMYCVNDASGTPITSGSVQLTSVNITTCGSEIVGSFELWKNVVAGDSINDYSTSPATAVTGWANINDSDYDPLLVGATIGQTVGYDTSLTYSIVDVISESATIVVGSLPVHEKMIDKVISECNYFDNHPSIGKARVRWHATTGGTGIITDSITGLNTYYDVDNYAVMDEHEIKKMHETALLSLFDVPQMGRLK